MAPDNAAIRWPLIMAVAFTGAVHAVWLFSGGAEALEGGLIDGDSYLRLLRLQRLLATGDWFDVSIPRANAPYGATLHWTRPLDVLILNIAAILAPFMDFKAALHLAGIAVGPVTHLFSVIAMAWAAAPLIGRLGSALAGGLTVAQPAFMDYAAFGRADHHSLIALFTILAFGFAVRSLSAIPYRHYYSLGAGFMLAACLWMGPEAYAIIALCLIMMGLPWLLCERGFAARNFHLCLGLALSTALMLLAERGFAGYLDIEYDRLSIVHLTLGALLLAFWPLAVAMEKRLAGAKLRLAVAAFGSSVIVACLLILYPLILQGPMAGADPEFFPLVSQISEFRGIDNLPRFLLLAGSAIFALPWAIWRTFIERKTKWRWAWVLLCVALIFYLSMSVHFIRGALFAGIFLAPPLAGLIIQADLALSRRFINPWRALVKVPAILIIAVGPLFIGALAVGKSAAAAKPACPLREMADYLNQPPWSRRPQVIIASANFGPELLYRTNHSVLATLHHRGAKGILDGISILSGEDDEKSLRLASQRRADLILLCPDSANDGYFQAAGGEKSLYRRLIRGDIPPWLRPVALPGQLAEHFRLFQTSTTGT